MKKLTLLFTLALLAVIPTWAELQQSDGKYLIATAQDLVDFASKVNSGATTAQAIFTNNIDCTGRTDFTGIGTEAKPFAGTLEGQGNYITNLTIKQSSQSGVGLINYATSGCTIDWLIMGEGCSVSGQSYVGAFIGKVIGNKSGMVKLSRCANEGAVTASGNYAAGFIGGSENAPCRIVMRAVSNNGRIEADNYAAAFCGSFGNANSQVFNSYNIDHIERCNGGNTLGNGIAADRYVNSYDLVMPYRHDDEGNLLGEGESPAEGHTAYNGITVAAGELPGYQPDWLWNGHLCYILNGDQSEIVWRQNIEAHVHPMYSLSHLQVYRVGALNCDGTPAEGNTRDEYRNDPSMTTMAAHDYENGFCKNCGHRQPDFLRLTSDGFYELSNEHELYWFSKLAEENPKANARLTANINYTADKYKTDGRIGGSIEFPYQGIFDGQNHEIRVNLVNHDDYRFTALFPVVEGAQLRNMTLAGQITSSSTWVGGLVGEAYGAGTTLDNIMVTANITCTASGEGAVGGLVSTIGRNGWAADNIYIRNCAFVGSINAANCNGNGGLVGNCLQSDNTYIQHCFVAPTANFNWRKGSGNATSAAIGRNCGNISNCYYSNVGTQTENQGTAKTNDEVANGELAYTLNSGGGRWGQAIPSDTHPWPWGYTVYKKSDGTFTNDKVDVDPEGKYTGDNKGDNNSKNDGLMPILDFTKGVIFNADNSTKYYIHHDYYKFRFIQNTGTAPTLDPNEAGLFTIKKNSHVGWTGYTISCSGGTLTYDGENEWRLENANVTQGTNIRKTPLSDKRLGCNGELTFTSGAQTGSNYRWHFTTEAVGNYYKSYYNAHKAYTNSIRWADLPTLANIRSEIVEHLSGIDYDNNRAATIAKCNWFEEKPSDTKNSDLTRTQLLNTYGGEYANQYGILNKFKPIPSPIRQEAEVLLNRVVTWETLAEVTADITAFNNTYSLYILYYNELKREYDFNLHGEDLMLGMRPLARQLLSTYVDRSNVFTVTNNIKNCLYCLVARDQLEEAYKGALPEVLNAEVEALVNGSGITVDMLESETARMERLVKQCRDFRVFLLQANPTATSFDMDYTFSIKNPSATRGQLAWGDAGSFKHNGETEGNGEHDNFFDLTWPWGNVAMKQVVGDDLPDGTYDLSFYWQGSTVTGDWGDNFLSVYANSDPVPHYENEAGVDSEMLWPTGRGKNYGDTKNPDYRWGAWNNTYSGKGAFSVPATPGWKLATSKAVVKGGTGKFNLAVASCNDWTNIDGIRLTRKGIPSLPIKQTGNSGEQEGTHFVKSVSALSAIYNPNGMEGADGWNCNDNALTSEDPNDGYLDITSYYFNQDVKQTITNLPPGTYEVMVKFRKSDSSSSNPSFSFYTNGGGTTNGSIAPTECTTSETTETVTVEVTNGTLVLRAHAEGDAGSNDVVKFCITDLRYQGFSGNYPENTELTYSRFINPGFELGNMAGWETPARSVNTGLISRTGKKSQQVMVNVTGAKYLKIDVRDNGDGINYDRADLVTPILIDAEGNETILTTSNFSCTFTQTGNSWGTLHQDTNVEGGSIQIEGQTYAQGLGMNANCTLTYTLPDNHQYTTFYGLCGYDSSCDTDNPGTGGTTMVFVVEALDASNKVIVDGYRDTGVKSNAEQRYNTTNQNYEANTAFAFNSGGSYLFNTWDATQGNVFGQPVYQEIGGLATTGIYKLEANVAVLGTGTVVLTANGPGVVCNSSEPKRSHRSNDHFMLPASLTFKAVAGKPVVVGARGNDCYKVDDFKLTYLGSSAATVLDAVLSKCETWTTQNGAASATTTDFVGRKAYYNANKNSLNEEQKLAAVNWLNTHYDNYCFDNASSAHPYEMPDACFQFDNSCRTLRGIDGYDITTQMGTRPDGSTGTYWAGHKAARYEGHVYAPYYGAYRVVTQLKRETDAAAASVQVGLHTKGANGMTETKTGYAEGWDDATYHFGFGHDVDWRGYKDFPTTITINENSYVGGMQLYYVGQTHEVEGTQTHVKYYFGRYESPVTFASTPNFPAICAHDAQIPAGCTFDRTQNPNGLLFLSKQGVDPVVVNVNYPNTPLKDENNAEGNKTNIVRETDMEVMACVALKLTDGANYNFVSPYAFEAQTATYTLGSVGTLTNAAAHAPNTFATLCLPFDYKSVPTATHYEKEEDGEGNTTYKEVTEPGYVWVIDPQQPLVAGGYVYVQEVDPATTDMVSRPALVEKAGNYSATNALVTATAWGETSYDGMMAGVYQKTKPDQLTWVLQNHSTDGLAFYRVNDETYVEAKQPWLNPFRCYILRLPGDEQSATQTQQSVRKMTVVFPTGEQLELDEETGEELDGEHATGIYDLSGRKLERTTQRGIYIKNGKKIVVR